MIGGKTAGELTAELAVLGAEAMVSVLDAFDAHRPESQPEHGVTYAAKIDKAETRLDSRGPTWKSSARSAPSIPPAPGSNFAGSASVSAPQQMFPGEGRGPAAPDFGVRPSPGSVLDHALTIACGEGAIVPTLVQRAGRAAMTADELVRGFPIPKGTRLA